MDARRLPDLTQRPVSERLGIIAEGLELLAEQAVTLRADATALFDAGHRRGHAVLAAHADEESAKALILLDLVRAGWRDQKQAQRQIGYFYNHLARIIYAEMVHMSPATFGEVRQLVDIYRPSHYLDGPTDVDFVFRNEGLARREESIYVDYVSDEDGHVGSHPPAWTTWVSATCPSSRTSSSRSAARG